MTEAMALFFDIIPVGNDRGNNFNWDWSSGRSQEIVPAPVGAGVYTMLKIVSRIVS